MRRLRRLIAKRSARWDERAFVAEGIDLFDAAGSVGVLAESVFIAAEGLRDERVADVRTRALEAGCRVFELAPGVMKKVSDTVTPQPVVSVVKMVDIGIENVKGGKLVVVCADVRDPGNAGTVLRSASAAGADAVVFTGSSVDPYNPKTARSSAGSLFFVPLVIEQDLRRVMLELAKMGYRRLGAVVNGGVDYATLDWSVATALVVGNEASGLTKETLLQLDGQVAIPMVGHTDSLNVGVACAIMCFEALRQRRRCADETALGTDVTDVDARREWSAQC